MANRVKPRPSGKFNFWRIGASSFLHHPKAKKLSPLFTASIIQRETIHKNLGGTVNALDAWLVLRGLRTFALRMEAHNRNGQTVAEWLPRRPEISRAYYPGFASSSQPDLFRRQMKHGGALLSFELVAGKDAACRFLDRIELVFHAVSMGGMESLTMRPAMSNHRRMTSEARLRAGISDSLIRLSVGVEAIEDLLADLEQAIAG